jgi:hypothetical protein
MHFDRQLVKILTGSDRLKPAMQAANVAGSSRPKAGVAASEVIATKQSSD